MAPDALPYLPSRAAWHRLGAWWHAQAPFLTAYWASRYWHTERHLWNHNRKDHP